MSWLMSTLLVKLPLRLRASSSQSTYSANLASSHPTPPSLGATSCYVTEYVNFNCVPRISVLINAHGQQCRSNIFEDSSDFHNPQIGCRHRPSCSFCKAVSRSAYIRLHAFSACATDNCGETVYIMASSKDKFWCHSSPSLSSFSYDVLGTSMGFTKCYASSG